jgi:uncharacterized protein with PQ loop repeat
MSVTYTYKNIILLVCNVINVIYHLPQIIKTYKTKSVKDFDPYYLFLGNLHSFCWVLYSIEDNNSLMIFNSCVTMFSISFVSYYKIHSCIIEFYKNKNLNNLPITITITNIEDNKENNTYTNTENNKENNSHKIITVSSE